MDGGVKLQIVNLLKAFRVLRGMFPPLHGHEPCFLLRGLFTAGFANVVVFTCFG